MRLKLVSRKDTLLGHIDVPDHWREWFEQNRAVQSYIVPRLRFVAPAHKAEIAMPTVERLTLLRADWSQYPEAVTLVEGNIEQLEALPECSFTPSMAYLRSQLEKHE